MRHISILPKHAYIVLSTLFILFGLFAYYFWIYLPNQEKLLIAKQSRTLEQIAVNFRSKDNVYRKTAEVYKDFKLDIITPASISKGNPDLILDTNNIYEKDSAGYIDYSPDSLNRIICPVNKILPLPKKEESLYQPYKEGLFEHFILYKDKILALKTWDAYSAIYVDSLNGSPLNISHSLKLEELPDKYGLLDDGQNVRMSAVNYKLFSTRFKTENHTWTLYALVSKESFDAEINRIPVLMVITIVLVILILIFSLPLIKLALMSSIERLNRTDVVLSSSSFIICTGLLVLILLFGITLQADKTKIDAGLKKLSSNVTENIDAELEGIRTLLMNMEKSPDLDPVKNANRELSFFKNPKLLQQLKTDYYFLRNLYWMDSIGNRIHQVSTVLDNDDVLPSQSFKERAYFREIVEGRGWKYDQDSKPFLLESINSWINSDKLLVFSVPVYDASGNIKNVLAASVRFHPVIDPLLPDPFSFYIIDDRGNILFHSNSEKNLQENLLIELDNPNGIRSAIIGKNSGYLNAKSGSDKHRIFITPLNNTPWMLITSYDNTYNDLPYLQIISISVIYILTIGFFVFFHLYLLSLFDSRPTKLSKQAFNYNWLWPKEGRKGSYFKLALYNIGLAVLLIIYYVSTDLTMIQVLSFFLYSVLFANSSAWLIFEGNLKSQNANRTIVYAATISVSLLIFALTTQLTNDWYNNSVILVLVAGISAMTQISWQKISERFVTLKGWLDFKKMYRIMLFTFLIVSSVLPALFLYRTAYQQEKKIWEKFDMYRISQSEVARNARMRKLYLTNENHVERQRIFEEATTVGKYYEALGFQACKCDQEQKIKIPPTKLDIFSYKTRPFFTNLYVASNGFVFPNGANEWETSHCNTHGICFKYYSHQFPEDSVILAVSFKGTALGTEPGNSYLWFVLLLVGFLVALYYLIRFATNKFFVLNMFDNIQPIEMDDAYLKTYFDNFKNETQKHLFIVALPFAGVHFLYKKYHFQVFDVSRMTMNDVKKNKLKHLILEHFSYSIEDIQTNGQILDMVEQLLNNQNTLIIISKLSPTQIINKYESLMLQINDPEKKREFEIQVSKWKNILAGFVKVYYSLLHDDALQKEYSDNLSIVDMIEYECRVNEHYFQPIKKMFAKKGTNGNELVNEWVKVNKKGTLNPQKYQDMKEEVVLKIQSMAQPYYYSLWNTCSKEEKYLLYDLAMDGFVNTQNERGLKVLLEKGLIYYRGALHLMNESFRNFILSTIQQSEALEMEKELKQTGTWSLYRSVFLVLFIGLAVFVSVTQQEIIKQFSALIVAIATSIPYLLKFSGIFTIMSGRNKISSPE